MRQKRRIGRTCTLQLYDYLSCGMGSLRLSARSEKEAPHFILVQGVTS